MSTSIPLQDASVTPTDAARRLTLVLYVLYALTPFTLLSGLIAILINHIKYSDASKTLYGSHFRWLMRTFWWSVLWWVGLVAAAIYGRFFGAGFWQAAPFLAVPLLLLNPLWVVYRIIRGALACIDGRRMPV